MAAGEKQETRRRLREIAWSEYEWLVAKHWKMLREPANPIPQEILEKRLEIHRLSFKYWLNE